MSDEFIKIRGVRVHPGTNFTSVTDGNPLRLQRCVPATPDFALTCTQRLAHVKRITIISSQRTGSGGEVKAGGFGPRGLQA